MIKMLFLNYGKLQGLQGSTMAEVMKVIENLSELKSTPSKAHAVIVAL